MTAILLESVSFHYPAPYVPIFEDLSLGIDLDWKTAVIGRNGRGKTTLLHLIERRLEPFRGNVNVPIEVSYFPPGRIRERQTVLEVVKDAVAPFSLWERQMEELLEAATEESLAEYARIAEEYQRLGGYEIEAHIERELAQIGMDASLLERRFGSLSGGEQTRALIISLFLKRQTFPLIDEPTNHLDMAGRELLGEYLGRKPGFILVSHDRHLIDLCADHLVALNRSDVEVFQCNYSAWRRQMDLEEKSERHRAENLQREIRSLERTARRRRVWADRKEREKIGGGDKGAIGHQAAKLMKRALDVERRVEGRIAEKKGLLKNVEKQYKLRIQPESGGPQRVVSLSRIALELGERQILQDFSLTVQQGERVAIAGPNGSGKSTLLRLIAGEIEADSGLRTVRRFVKMARACQHPRWSRGLLREQVESHGIDETQFRNVMGVLGVSGEIFDRPLETFSEGERKKVDLSRSFLAPCHLFLWDEPLNYLDIATREQIEEAILESGPTMVFVEHDRYFIDQVATRVVTLGKAGG